MTIKSGFYQKTLYYFFYYIDQGCIVCYIWKKIGDNGLIKYRTIFPDIIIKIIILTIMGAVVQSMNKKRNLNT
jgi:hypothetical protein